MTTAMITAKHISLYDMTSDALRAVDLLEEVMGDTEISDEIRAGRIETLMDELATSAEEIPAKFESIAGYIKTQAGAAEAIRTEEKRLADKRHAIERRIDTLKNGYLLPCITALEDKKFRSALWSISIRKDDAVQITDENALPKEYWRVKREPMKGEIKMVIKAGFDVPGAALVTKESVVIK